MTDVNAPTLSTEPEPAVGEAASCATPIEAGPPKPETIFYDGHCGLCHRSVKFVAPRDDRGLFDFAPLRGEYIQQVVPAERRERLPDSIVVRTRGGELLTHSSAIAHILKRLGGVWGVVGWALWLIPRPIRNLGYNAVAKVRHRLFARPDEACPLMPPALRGRFRY